MKHTVVFGTALVALAGLLQGCSSDDTAAPEGQAGGGGSAGTAGAAGAKAAGTGGAAGAGVAGAGGTSIAGAGGTAGGGGAGGGSAGAAGSSAGAGGTDVIVDPCEGKFNLLPFAVSSGFNTIRTCSGGTCTAPEMPYYFAQIPNPNCDEVFPDGGIVPPFTDAGTADGAATTDAAVGEAGLAADGSDADAGSSDATSIDADAPAATEAGTVVEASAEARDAGASADVSVGAEASIDGGARDAISDAAAPACYEFLYNPACTSGTCWGGVIFTQSAGGMADPGVCIEPGATKITFKAKASRPDARIKFGSIREGMGTTEFFMNITTEWAAYEVSIPPGELYNAYSQGGTGVWNGFSVIVEPQDHPGGTYIFVKDAVWSK